MNYTFELYRVDTPRYSHSVALQINNGTLTTSCQPSVLSCLIFCLTSYFSVSPDKTLPAHSGTPSPPSGLLSSDPRKWTDEWRDRTANHPKMAAIRSRLEPRREENSGPAQGAAGRNERRKSGARRRERQGAPFSAPPPLALRSDSPLGQPCTLAISTEISAKTSTYGIAPYAFLTVKAELKSHTFWKRQTAMKMSWPDQ